jgi:predicted RNase H-like HicB family nuclease
MLEGLGSLIWIKSRKGRLPAPFELLNLHTNRESCILKGDRKPPSPQTLAPALILLGLFCCLRMSQNSIYPLRVQQSKLDGWWFIFVDEVPGLGVLGPNYEDLLDRLKVVAGNVFRARGETVTDIKIIPSETPALQVLH